MEQDKAYKEFIVGLLKDENFDRLLLDIRTILLNRIASTKPEENEKREALYYQIQGVSSVKKEAVLAAKRKVTGGSD